MTVVEKVIKMKIGILTNWQVPNYGAWIQAYALNNVIRNMVPNAEVEHIAYLEKSHWDYYYKNDFKGLNNFNYNWDNIPHSIVLTNETIDSYVADIIITGSDSIWEEINTGAYNFEPHLVGLGFDRCKKIIAYAPSSGVLEYGEGGYDEMRKGLKKYAHISVRDESTQDLVFNLIGTKPNIVLDPSLLWDFRNDAKIKTPIYNRYIAVYGGQWTDEFIQKAKEFAQRTGCLLISIGFINDWCDVSFRRIELRTFEWLGFVKNAKYVFTSTFHGLMMGINFRKQVKFCQIDYVKNRSQTLLDKLELNSITNSFEIDIDYGRIEPILEKLKLNSMGWLYSAINE